MKRQAGFLRKVQFHTFRDRKVAAPLKHTHAHGRRPRQLPFRDRKVAAPLKPGRTMRATPDEIDLPRPKGRGPIEAQWGRQIQSSGISALPRPKGRGPIEAIRARGPASGIMTLPRPKGRGPIEAEWAAAQSPEGITPFRDRKVAAPLKHWRHHHHRGHMACLPRPKGRGPIEAGSLHLFRILIAGLPQPKGRGPIEACGLGGGGPAWAKHSATERSRPRWSPLPPATPARRGPGHSATEVLRPNKADTRR